MNSPRGAQKGCFCRHSSSVSADLGFSRGFLQFAVLKLLFESNYNRSLLKTDQCLMTNSFVCRWQIFKKRLISQILNRWLIDNKTTLTHLYNIHKNMYIVRKVYGFHVVIYIYYSDKIYTIILKLNKIIINPLKVSRLCSYL